MSHMRKAIKATIIESKVKANLKIPNPICPIENLATPKPPDKNYKPKKPKLDF